MLDRKQQEDYKEISIITIIKRAGERPIVREGKERARERTKIQMSVRHAGQKIVKARKRR